MEEIASPERPAAAAEAPSGGGPAWSDLREWLALIECGGQLKRIAGEVDPEEELAAITFMATRREDAPALLFERLKGDATGSRILANMLGASKERFALAFGLEPALPLPEMIRATRAIMRRRVRPRLIPPEAAPVNETVMRGKDVDLQRFPAPKFWPGDGGRYIGTGDVTFTRDPASGRINVGVYRQMVHARDRVGLYCSPGKGGR
ncbi:MAG TPA: UbiD family decarboxylase, partial [Alphaproteobacteria bacterium]|nr:UbiD family decarboxylase [Alphaproteobacteria bacterium]